MNNYNGYFKSIDNIKLYEQYWEPEKEAKAIVLIIHGYAEHSNRYIHVADFLTANGYIVASFDLRGHGKSEGPRTYINSFSEYIDDLNKFILRVKSKYENTPMFLLGHSMGGAIVALLSLSLKEDVKGIIFSSPALKISDEISPFLVKISGIIGKLFPKLPTIKLDSNALSRDKEIVKKYHDDPLVYNGGIPARTGSEINKTIKIIQNQMNVISVPLLIIHGTQDKLSDPEGSKLLYNRVSSTDKKLKLYDGLYHELMNEPEKEQVLQDIVDWLEQRYR